MTQSMKEKIQTKNDPKKSMNTRFLSKRKRKAPVRLDDTDLALRLWKVTLKNAHYIREKPTLFQRIKGCFCFRFGERYRVEMQAYENAKNSLPKIPEDQPVDLEDNELAKDEHILEKSASTNISEMPYELLSRTKTA